jgi:hypothetical protein
MAPAFLYGGGADKNIDPLDASGSTINKVLVGGAGKQNTFDGSIGRELLIAGLGAGSADDIMVRVWTGYTDSASSAMSYDSS